MIFWHSLENAHRKIVTVKEFLERGVSFGSTRRGNKNIFKKRMKIGLTMQTCFILLPLIFELKLKPF